MGLFSRLFAGANSSISPKQAYEAHATDAILVDVKGRMTAWAAAGLPVAACGGGSGGIR